MECCQKDSPKFWIVFADSLDNLDIHIQSEVPMQGTLSFFDKKGNLLVSVKISRRASRIPAKLITEWDMIWFTRAVEQPNIE